MAMLEVKHLFKTFNTGFLGTHKIVAVHDVSFSLTEGKVLGLVGMSGSGKSTLARLIMGLIQVDSGKIYFNGQDITSQKGKERLERALNLQMLFQHPTEALNPRMLLRDSLREPFLLHKTMLKKKDMDEMINAKLKVVSLDFNLLDRYPHQLSGGQLQRLCLARLLLLAPKYIVLDEPTSMLDVSVQAQVMNLLDRIRHEDGISYLFISHDLDLVRAYSDDIAVMYQGKIIEQQSAARFYEDAREEYTRTLIKAFREM